MCLQNTFCDEKNVELEKKIPYPNFRSQNDSTSLGVEIKPGIVAAVPKKV